MPTTLAPDAPTTTAKAQILLVDDHPIVRQGLGQLINHAPDLAVCASVEDGQEAIDYVKQTRPDLVVVDLTLKDRSGLDVVKELKAMDGTLPVLVLSMHDESLHAERALRAGAQGYIMKEEATERVLDAIRQVLKGEIYVSPRVTSHMLQKMVSVKPGEGGSPLAVLTDREHEVFLMIGQGMPAREIAAKLGLSSKTIDAHRENIKAKLGFKTGQELLRYAMQYTIDSGH